LRKRIFRDWQNYYLLVGSAAGALIGLMFVVTTLTAGLDANRVSRGAKPEEGEDGVFLIPLPVCVGPRFVMANSKDVVVTGVSTGIGRGATKVLLSKGFRVFGSVRKQADADRLQKEFGDSFVPLMMDVTDADAVLEAAQKVGSMIGDRNLLGLVNNVGIVVSGPLLYLRISELRRQLEVNTIAPLVVIQAFAPLLGTDKKRQGPAGRIVNITSSGAKLAIPLLGAYSASKFGLEGMSDALRRELMVFGIDVVIIEPGTVNTAMYDKGEKEDLSEFKQTEYWEAVQNFQKWIVNEARTNGLPPERLGEAIHVALTAAKPKVRYAVIPQRFKNWTLPRLLPARMVDAEMAKQMKLTKQRELRSTARS